MPARSASGRGPPAIDRRLAEGPVGDTLAYMLVARAAMQHAKLHEGCLPHCPVVQDVD
jgi:hypothetical protein